MNPPNRLLPVAADGTSAEPIALDGEFVSAGRGLENGIVLGGPRVSRVHCAFHRLEDGGFKVVDAGSRNGTLVNGQLVVQKVLRPGDRIDIGGHVFTFAPAEPPAARRPAAPDAAPPSRADALAPERTEADARPVPSGRPARRPAPARRQRGGLAAPVLACAAVLLAGITIGLAVSRGGEPAAGGSRGARTAAGGAPRLPAEPVPGAAVAAPQNSSGGTLVAREVDPERRAANPSPAGPEVEPGAPPATRDPVAKDAAPVASSEPPRARLTLSAARDGAARARALARAFLFVEARDEVDSLDGPNEGAFVDDEIEFARAECDALRVAHDRLVAKLAEAGAKKLRLVSLPGRGAVRGATPTGVLAGGTEVPWREVSPETYEALLRAAEPGAESLLALAYRAFSRGADDDAHRALERALEIEPGLVGEATRLLVRELETPLPEGGFVVHEHRFTTPERRDALVAEARAKTLFASATGDDPAAARSAVEAIAGLGPEHQERLDALLLDRLRVAEDAVRKDGGAKRFAALLEQRTLLEEGRRAALELIFDSEKYPFPHDGDVPKGTRTLHDKTQVEIDRRVAALRKILEDAETEAVTIPSDLRKRGAALAAALGLFEAAGRPAPKLSGDVACLAFLQEDEKKVSALTICASAAERTARERDARTMAANESIASTASAAERTQLRVTNEYRLLMGRAALALDERLLLAARDHCHEMYKCGYFGHQGATPETSTLQLRVRARGYDSAMVGENIARGTSPQHAHSLWLHSSGHHRNILNEQWTRAGTAVAGDLYTQNFGTGESE